MSSLTENWLFIGNNYYIIYHFYNMFWDVDDLSKYHIAHEMYGGSIALLQKGNTKQTLSVYSGSGKLIATAELKDPNFIGLTWGDKEKLYLLRSRGCVEIFDMHCQNEDYFKMGQKVEDDHVKCFRFFQTLKGIGLMTLTESNIFFYKTDISNKHSNIVRITFNKQFLKDSYVDNWTVLCLNGSVCVLFASKNQLVQFENGKESQLFGSETQWFQNTSRIVKMSLSLSQQKLALLHDNGMVHIIPTQNIAQVLADYQLPFTIPTISESRDLLRIEWAGEELLSVFYPDNLYFMDLNQPNEVTDRFYMDIPEMFPEIDGLRLLTCGKHEFVQKIPYELEQLYQFHSDSPSVCLFDAQTHLDNNSYDTARFIEQLKSKPDYMKRAIDSCLIAASSCLEPHWQKTILKAVRLGRSFLPDYKSDKVADMHNKLLLLNNLKQPFIAMPLTMQQLDQMTLAVLFDRLIARHYYPFIERICQRQPTLFASSVNGNLGINRMLEYWAEKRIQSIGTSLEAQLQLANTLIDRLQHHQKFDYARLSLLACKLNKPELAEKLLEHESRIEEQVKILMKLGKEKQAITQAVLSGSLDLLSLVMVELQQKKPLELYWAIRTYPVAKSLYMEHLLYLEGDSSGNTGITSNMDGPESDSEKAERMLAKLVKSETIQNGLSSINETSYLFKSSENEFMVQMLEDQKQLWIHQRETFKEELTQNSSLSDMSIHDYVLHLYNNRHEDRVDRLRNKLKLSDRLLNYLRVKSYLTNHRWPELKQLLLVGGEILASQNQTITTTKLASMIGYYDLAEMCADYLVESDSNSADSNRHCIVVKQFFDCFVDKVDPDRRVKLLVKLDRMTEAEELARSIRSDYLVSYVNAMKINF